MSSDRLPTLTELIALERAHYRAISNCHPRPWGEIARNDHNPDSHDSNHAFISAPVNAEQFGNVLEEVETFYRDAPAGARVRYYTACVPAGLLHVAVEKGWQTRLEESTWRAWPVTSEVAAEPEISGLAIHQPITDADIQACHLVRQENEPAESKTRLQKTWEHLTLAANVTPLLARLDGEPAAVLAIVWTDRWGVIDAVKTRECFRRRGICSALLRFVQKLAIARECDGLMLYDIEEGPDRVYARTGFQLIGRTHCAIAWRECRNY